MERIDEMLDFPEQNLNPPDDPVIHCPVCGDDCLSVYIDDRGEVVACNECLSKQFYEVSSDEFVPRYGEDYKCPNCGSDECDYLYYENVVEWQLGTDAFACEECIDNVFDEQEAWEWYEDEKQAELDDYYDMKMRKQIERRLFGYEE